MEKRLQIGKNLANFYVLSDIVDKFQSISEKYFYWFSEMG